MVNRLNEPPKDTRAWACGSKLTLFTSASEEWQRAKDANSVGIFYTNMTKKFIAKYGWHFDWKLDKVCPDPSPEDWQDIMDHTGLTDAEIEKRNKYYTKLRTVSATQCNITCITDLDA